MSRASQKKIKVQHVMLSTMLTADQYRIVKHGIKSNFGEQLLQEVENYTDIIAFI